MDYELKTIDETKTTEVPIPSQSDDSSFSNARDRYALARLGKKQVLKVQSIYHRIHEALMRMVDLI